MANGHVENHNPKSSHKSQTSGPDAGHNPASDTDSMDDTEEYKLLRAYATRRRPKKEAGTHKGDTEASAKTGNEANGAPASQKPAKTDNEEKKEEKKTRKKRKGLKRLSFFKCIQPQADAEEEEDKAPEKPANDQHDDMNRGFYPVKDEDELEKVAGRLMGIADEIQFVPPEIESDSGETDPPHKGQVYENVEKVIGLLLRENGDRLNEEMKAANITSDLFMNYDFFRTLLSTFLRRIGFRSSSPNALGPQASPKTQIAVTCEITSRLSAVDTLPSRRLLQYGAQYLQQYYSNWVQEHGGYEAAVESDDEVE